jgi:SAM-dependent methyltransferase
MNEQGKLYVQYGCGFSAAEGWLNFDSSPTLRIERLPIIGKVTSKYLANNNAFFPKSVRYGDIVNGLPVADNSVDGCYASHVLEHVSLSDFRKALKNTAKIMKKDGIFRVVVPDLYQKAKVYVNSVNNGDGAASIKFMQSTLLGQETRPRSLLQMARNMLGGSQHLWMWDELSISEELKKAGFGNIRICDFGDSGDPMFQGVEDINRFYDSETNLKECCVEARLL